MAESPNKAATDANGYETNKPAKAANNVSSVVTTAKGATGNVEGTTIDKLNYEIDHACDFVSDTKRFIGLKKFIKAIAKEVREGIRAIMRALGMTDPTGSLSTEVNKAKSYAEELNRIKKEYLDPVIEFQTYVLAYLVKIRSMVTWILSLPARILKLLQTCVSKLLKSLANAFTDGLKEAAAEVPLSEGTAAGTSQITSTIKETQSTIKAAQGVVKAATKIVAGTAAIAVSATAGLVTPTSAADLKNANTIIKNYEKSTPTIDQSSASTPSQSNSNGP
jgi:hypothetical protein